MTDLTDKWKKGEFIICNAGKCQYYYVQNEEQREVIKTEYCLFDDNTPNWQILAPVPTFDEWQASENYIDYLKQCISVYESKEKQHTDDAIAYNELTEENEKLKELLEWCRDELFEVYSNEVSHPEDVPIIKKLDEVLK